MAPAKVTKVTPEAFLLTGIGGCIDSVGILSLGDLFVSHMSGNSAALGAAFGQGRWQVGLPHLFSVPIFVFGLFLGYIAMASDLSFRRCAWVLIVEAGLLMLFAAALITRGDPAGGTLQFYAIATPALLAMGLQNSTLRMIGRSVTPSTYITGVLDTLSKSLALAWLNWRRTRAGESIPEHCQGDNVADAQRAAAIWGCYVIGAVLGSAGLLLLGSKILLAPIVILLGVALQFFSMGKPSA